MKRREMISRTLMIATVVMLSACGFHLRGSIQATLPFKTMYVGFPDSSPLGADLKRYIPSGGTTQVVTNAKDAEAILESISETREKTVLSLNSQGRVREYNLYYKLIFRVKDNKNQELLGPTEVIVRRDLSFNESQALAKEAEETMLYRDMQTDLVQQVLRRLAAIKTVQAAPAATTAPVDPKTEIKPADTKAVGPKPAP
jgi:LPS-assembly lipoprotein